ncbi:DUF115 domain-containing protein, partial [bacterium]|nr:DUF115 domain-containing protein [bacterium]
GLLTKFKDGPRCLSNLFGNLPAFTNARGLSTIGDSLKERPAIIVAAGPSLAYNLEQLKQCEDRFVIIATDTVHKTLLSHGITPHFVVTVDPTELNLSHFPDESYSDESVLIFDPESRAEIPLKFKHRMTYITNKHPFFDWLESQVGQKGKIAKGGMVSHTAFHIAQYFGCSPIIFIGLDLALNPSDGGTHIQNTAVYRNVHYLDDDPTHVEVPYPHMENKTFREPLFWVDGIKGEKVPTIQSFLIYIRMLEEDIRKTQTPVIDATEGGAKIEGTQIKPLSEVMNMEEKGGAAISTTLQPIFQEPDAPVSHDPQACRHTIRELLRDKVERAQSGLHKMDEYSHMELSEIQQVIETKRQNIISDEVSEYCIEYAAPRELFRFLQLGPANADGEKKKEIALQRLKALFDATLQANEMLMKDLK